MIKFVVDVDLSPDWVDVFASEGWTAMHWSTVGDPRANDRTVMAWARANRYVVFTHDLDWLDGSLGNRDSIGLCGNVSLRISPGSFERPGRTHSWNSRVLTMMAGQRRQLRGPRRHFVRCDGQPPRGEVHVRRGVPAVIEFSWRLCQS